MSYRFTSPFEDPVARRPVEFVNERVYDMDVSEDDSERVVEAVVVELEYV